MSKLIQEHQKTLELIGKQLKVMRLSQGKSSYRDYSEKMGIHENTYYFLERGIRDYTISSLLEVLSQYPDVKLSMFFSDAGL